MRIHDLDNDRTLSEISIYLTTSELAHLYGLLGSMLKDTRARQTSVSDDSFSHTLTVVRYHPMETSGLDSRQKEIVREDT